MEFQHEAADRPELVNRDAGFSGDQQAFDAITPDASIDAGDIDDDALPVDAPQLETAEPAIVRETPRERVNRTAADVASNPDRRRFSSSESVRIFKDASSNYRHELWLPHQDADGTERPGYLNTTAYLDDNGYPARYGEAMDRYHYRTASGLATFAYDGFAPVMSSIGIDTTCMVRNKYYDRRCQVQVAFGSAETTAQQANALLEASGESLRFEVLQPGMYSSEQYIDLVADRKYPLTREWPTPAKESSYLEHGSHDVLQHAACIVALAGTRALDRVQERAQGLRDGSAYQHAPDESTQSWLRGQFMRQADGALNVINFSELLRGDREAFDRMRSLLDLRGREPVQPYLDEILENLRSPQTSGRLVLPL